jgi:catechol 2,3-dioxygenase-like lactoylglutathione lyase family enzyme
MGGITMIKTIEAIVIMVNDIQKSVEFYNDVLGFSISNKIDMAEVGLSAVFVEKDGSRIGLMNYKGKKIPKRLEIGKIELGESSIPINDHITFSVDDIEATTTELKGKGVVFNLEPIQLEGGIKVAFFKDPEGVQIELVEHPKQ